MDGKNTEMCDTLIQWFQKLNIDGPHKNAIELSDGVAMAKALNQIAPDVFTDTWLGQIKVDVGTNWRLKASNIRKIVDFLIDSYSDVLNLSFVDFIKIDVGEIAENANRIEIGRLLQLILGFAVNCSTKQQYITQIMELEESLQQNIMQALQELESAWQGSAPRPTSSTISITNVDDKIGQNERDALAQRCHEAERRISMLLDEKNSLQHENTKLMQELEKYQNHSAIGDDGISLGPVNPGSSRYTDLRRQLDDLKDELLQAETSRDDHKIKSKQQEAEILALRMKVDELNHSNAELAILKDEIDVLREASDKLRIYENQVATYKKKLEDSNDLKRQIKILEERSVSYYQQNANQEEQMKRMAALKSQIDMYKEEIEQLNGKLDTEMMKSVKIEFELNNATGKCTELQRENDSLMNERDILREMCDELRCNQLSTDSANNVSNELMPPIWKDKIERLEAENKALRSNSSGESILTQYMDDANQRTERLRDQLKQANQKILSLTHGQTEDHTEKSNLTLQLKQSMERNEQKATEIDEAQAQIFQQQTKISQLETALNVREQELIAAEERYRKNVEKAKEVIKSYDFKESIIQDKANDNETTENAYPAMNSTDERLMTTAFYRLANQCAQDATDARIAKLTGSGQSFLTRQRQPAARKPIVFKK